MAAAATRYVMLTYACYLFTSVIFVFYIDYYVRLITFIFADVVYTLIIAFICNINVIGSVKYTAKEISSNYKVTTSEMCLLYLATGTGSAVSYDILFKIAKSQEMFKYKQTGLDKK